MRRSGFTLLELTIVLFIVGLSVTLISPSLTRFSRSAEMRATAQKISSILRNSRSEAVHRREIHQVLFDSGSKRVKVQAIKPEDLESEETKEKSPPARTFSLPEWIQIREMKTWANQISTELPTIEFYPNGGSNGGSFLLEGEGQRGYRIQVHSVTGAVKIERI